MNLNNKKFVTTQNKNGLSSDETIFYYKQEGNIISATYKGGAIKKGLIIGKQIEDSKIELLYQCITIEGELKAGHSIGKVSFTNEGKLKLNLDWNWINGDLSKGKSEYIEID